MASSMLNYDSMDVEDSSYLSGAHSDVSPSTSIWHYPAAKVETHADEESIYSSSLLFSNSTPSFDDGRLTKSHDDVVVKSELTSSPDFRPTRLPTVPSTINTSHSHSSKAAISASTNSNSTYPSQDVDFFVNSATSHSSPVTRPGHPSQHFETNVSTFSSRSQQHGLNQPIKRPLPPNQVFASSKDLAAHYGIPQILPPAPRQTPRTTQRPAAQPAPASPTDYSTLANNYIAMLSQKPSNATTASDVVERSDLQADASQLGLQLADVDNLIQYFVNQPFTETQSFGELPETSQFDMQSSANTNASQYLTSPMLSDFDSSPMDDTPYSEFLNTPLMETLDGEPLIAGSSSFDGMSLFPEYELGFQGFPAAKESAAPASAPAPATSTAPTVESTSPLVNFDDLYTMSPTSPALDPSSLFESPSRPTRPLPSRASSQAPSAANSSTSRRKVSATGTRKGITPESLVPLDAPTQPRNYITPSATSRKAVPAVFARKRARSQALGEDDELEGMEPLSPNATEKEQIEWKRRQNTLAARKSRKRKLEHQKILEREVEELTNDRDMWRTRAETLQSVLKANGLPFAFPTEQ